MTTPVLSVRSLSKRFELYDRPADRLLQTLWRGRRQFYRDFWALRDVAFSLSPGQALGVVGRNGSGKSTLLQLVAGTLTPTTGDVEARGRISALLELGSGFDPEFTGRENAFLNGAILGVPHAEMRALLPELLAFADIGDFVDRPVKTYSSGMALRLAFAVATAVTPDILIVDEALAVGDEAFQRKCFARIERLRADGVAILFVSHSPQQVIELCDVALLLDGGEMLLHGDPRRVVSEYQRLLYAPAATIARVREELRGEGAVSASAAPPPPMVVPENAELVTSFDPHLASASLVEYAEHGARIVAPRLTTPDGTPANVLVRGEQYMISYDVDFTAPATRVMFGTMIKSIGGLELGGGTYPPPRAAAVDLAAGTRARLQFTFRCRLFPGMYFVNVGLTGNVDGDETYLHRLVDVLAFRVQSDPSVRPAGFVDLEVAGRIAHDA